MSFSHDLKLQRAFSHLMKIDELTKSWVNGDHHTVRMEYDENGDPVFLASADQPTEDPLSLLIGEFLHNTRSALDNLAYSLALNHTVPLPDEIAESCEFPIFGNKHGRGSATFHETTRGGDPTRRSGLHKIRGWAPGAQAVVERLQPYHRGNSYEGDPLWILHELDRVNKHRLLHSTVAHTEGFTLNPSGCVNLASFGPPQGESGMIESLNTPVETDTPICRLRNMRLNPSDPSRNVHMEIQPALQVAFGQGTPVVQYKSVYRTLSEVYMHIRGSVVPALTSYL